MDYVLTLDYARPPLTLNDRLHWAPRNALTQALRSHAGFWARSLRLGTVPLIEVTLTWFVKDERVRDADNIVPTLKALCDGLVDGALVVDDTPRYMRKHMPVIALDRRTAPHLELLVHVPTSDVSASMTTAAHAAERKAGA